MQTYIISFLYLDKNEKVMKPGSYMTVASSPEEALCRAVKGCEKFADPDIAIISVLPVQI